LTGSQLKKQRRARKLSRAALAERLGISTRTLEGLEQGRPIKPSLAKLIDVILRE